MLVDSAERGPSDHGVSEICPSRYPRKTCVMSDSDRGRPQRAIASCGEIVRPESQRSFTAKAGDLASPKRPLGNSSHVAPLASAISAAFRDGDGPREASVGGLSFPVVEGRIAYTCDASVADTTSSGGWLSVVG